MSRFYQAAINALELRLVEDPPGCIVPPKGFIPRACKDTALTAFAQLGALRLNVNRGLISLLDGRYQYILAEATRTLSLLPNIEPDPEDDLWLGSVIIPRSKGVCEHVLSLGDIIYEPAGAKSNVPAVIINDLAEDPRFSARPYVQSEPRVRFYAGVPLRSPWGTIIGAYCVFGHEPRNGLTQEQLLALQGIATTVMTYLETSKAKEGHRRYEQMLHGLTSFVTGESSIHSLDHRPQESSERKSPSHQISSTDTQVPDSMATMSQSASASIEKASKVSPEKDSSPKIKKRPRVLSTPGPAPRKRSTMSLQETMLPSGSKTMFSRAANIMRESIDVCGCIIFDASVATFGGAINAPHRRSFAKSQSEDHNHLASETKKDTGGNDPSPLERPWGVESKSSSSEGDNLTERKICEVLGSSIGGKAAVLDGEPDVYDTDFAESDLKRLLRRYPFGHIFNLSSSGDISQPQTSDSAPEMAPSSEAVDDKDYGVRAGKTSPVDKNNVTIERLLKIAPGARSIAILPLWDYQRDRWFAGCICWTTEPNRVLYPDVDLIYLQAFGNSIMTELSRLDAITSDRAKTTFVASISHELRCPLHGILGGVQFLQETDLDVYQAAMLDSISMCGKTLLDTIDHVLDFSKVNTFNKTPSKASSKNGQDAINLTGRPGDRSCTEPASLVADVDLAMLTEEVVEAVFAGQVHRGALSRLEQISGRSTSRRSSSSTKASLPIGTDQPAENLGTGSDGTVRLVLDIPHRSDWTVTTQPGAWRRIVMNLVGNALKYTKSGFIRISLRTRESELNAKKGPNKVEVTFIVSDTGKGMSAEYLRSGLWRPFSQEDSFSPGTGLGLSIVRQIVQGLKGRIDLKSEIQKGTEVKLSLSLPLAETPQTPDDEDSFLTQAAAQLRGRPVCILETTNPESLDGPSDLIQRGRREHGISIAKTLKDWFGADAVVSNVSTALSARVIICLEPDAEFLETLEGTTSPEKIPVVMFIALEGGGAAQLRSDPHFQGGNIVVDIITQP
ncbi:GAF domain-containing protein [Macrophomina phaseolina MS6]|uniref:GAF domain-containing protein n=1 Tax=Macrophomina phaseolina (strain MS6) TaxID=1126212 RepID=K2S6C7_MACPH|nr:GAF domain-containing protein [Macrophomina phaseolina MS6]